MVKYRSEELFAALGHPMRRNVVERLSKEGNIPLSDLARPFSMSLPAAMKHLAVLEQSGLVVSKKEGRVRYYALNPVALAEGMAWFVAMEEMWEGRLDRLEEYLKKKN